MVPRKSAREAVVGLETSRDFFRGLVDGDGYITFSDERSHGSPVVGLVGGPRICGQFAEFARGLANTRAEERPGNGIWGVRFSGRAALAVIRELYRGAEVALPEKAALAERAMAWVPQRRDWSWLTRPALESLLETHGDWGLVARAVGMQPDKLARHRLRPGLP